MAFLPAGGGAVSIGAGPAPVGGPAARGCEPAQPRTKGKRAKSFFHIGELLGRKSRRDPLATASESRPDNRRRLRNHFGFPAPSGTCRPPCRGRRGRGRDQG